MPEQSLANTFFSVRHITTFLHLGALDRTSAPGFRNPFKQWNHTHTHTNTNEKNMVLNFSQNGHLFPVWELEQEGSVNVHIGELPIFGCCARPWVTDYESATRIDLGLYK